MFEDRTDAGRRLAAALADGGVEADVVLTIPRGGLPVGSAVADELDAPLDIVVAEKIGAPNNPELAVGAVAGDGSRWLNEDLIDRLGVPEAYLDREAQREAENAREKVDAYRGGDPTADLTGRRVVLVDDGVATGATAIACLRQITAQDPPRVVFAVPVGPPQALDVLEREADEVVILESPRRFGAVGRHYRSFPQVSNEEALTYLRSE
ncbi:phosphoribosyltransferase [Halobacteriales archaeon QS_1_68_20]|nr:MAG: phosphoribosyltransferase [Halobacteriales archaeon QS_1_68_20]